MGGNAMRTQRVQVFMDAMQLLGAFMMGFGVAMLIIGMVVL